MCLGIHLSEHFHGSACRFQFCNNFFQKLQAIAEANSAVVHKHASADTTQEWNSVPHDIVANIVVVLHSYASVYSLPPPATQHGHQMQHVSSYLHQHGKKDDFLKSLHTSKENSQLLAPPYIKNSPDHVFTERTCTNDTDDDSTLAHNPEEELDRQILPDNLPDILPAAGLCETRLAYCENELAEYTNVVEGKSYPFVHVGE